MKVKWHIGTSGWHYRHWIGNFYPVDLAPGEWLAFYAEKFNTVELNNSFYGFPTATAIAHWLDATPEHFTFSVKANRRITHLKKLLQPENTLPPFMEVLAGMDTRRAPVLFQLPPHWRSNEERLGEFLNAWPSDRPCAFELRDPDWQREEIYALLRAHNAAFCIYDLGGFTSPFIATADFAYVRLHGPGAPYRGRYSASTLRQWMIQLQRLDVKHIYVYFDNDEAAYAVSNAIELQGFVA